MKRRAEKSQKCCAIIGVHGYDCKGKHLLPKYFQQSRVRRVNAEVFL